MAPFTLRRILAAMVFAAGSWTMAEAGEVEPRLRPGMFLEPFDVKDCTGPAAGKTLCYYCRYGLRPVAAVFVRAWTDEVTDLVVQLEREAARPRAQRLATLVVYVGPDSQELEQRLKALAADHRLVRTPLTIYRDTPEKLLHTLGLSADFSVAAYTWRQGALETARVFDDANLSADEKRGVVQDVQALD